MEGTGWNNSLNLAFNFFDELLFGKTVAICTNGKKGTIIGVEIYTSKGWSCKVIWSSDNYLANAVSKFIYTNFVGNRIFFVYFGEFWKIVGDSPINGWGVSTCFDGYLGVFGWNLYFFTFWKIWNKLSEEFGWYGDYTIIGAWDRKEINDSHI